jgi:DNA modification methylase
MTAPVHPINQDAVVKESSPSGELPFVERPEWTWLVTPRDLGNRELHRWFYFPHSFSPVLAKDLATEWSLPKSSTVLDPFAGAGTALLACQELGLSALGLDLSPLAAFATKVKLAPPSREHLRVTWRWVRMAAERYRSVDLNRYPETIRRAFDDETLVELDRLAQGLALVDGQGRDAIRLAVLKVLPQFSRLIRKGGWLASVAPAQPAARLLDIIDGLVNDFDEDLAIRDPHRSSASVVLADARRMPLENASIDALMTSPPYPNRHDYTRVFGVELAYAFLDDEGIRKLRRQSLESHPEARPQRPATDSYTPPSELEAAIDRIEAEADRIRVPNMLRGYFLDMYLVLAEAVRVLKPNARAAFVVGNARYMGVPLEVDTYLGRIGQALGLRVEHIYVARRRGNSAQQMGKHGRAPQRESVVVFRAPDCGG